MKIAYVLDRECLTTERAARSEEKTTKGDCRVSQEVSGLIFQGDHGSDNAFPLTATSIGESPGFVYEVDCQKTLGTLTRD